MAQQGHADQDEDAEDRSEIGDEDDAHPTIPLHIILPSYDTVASQLHRDETSESAHAFFLRLGTHSLSTHQLNLLTSELFTVFPTRESRLATAASELRKALGSDFRLVDSSDGNLIQNVTHEHILS